MKSPPKLERLALAQDGIGLDAGMVGVALAALDGEVHVHHIDDLVGLASHDVGLGDAEALGHVDEDVGGKVGHRDGL